MYNRIGKRPSSSSAAGLSQRQVGKGMHLDRPRQPHSTAQPVNVMTGPMYCGLLLLSITLIVYSAHVIINRADKVYRPSFKSLLHRNTTTPAPPGVIQTTQVVDRADHDTSTIQADLDKRLTDSGPPQTVKTITPDISNDGGSDSQTMASIETSTMENSPQLAKDGAEAQQATSPGYDEDL